ncbi:sensor domain CHASE1-containing protein [Fulvimarina manganoxydans]|uniref:histidine kinase n=1 Tax=Fulvimarina manganoxydans TaxID=937218 RepID=A0A1W1YVP3_9HYPH|nr:sensor domain CHASE1-containing protein [Fulvimarina manganoxydans]
MPFSLRLVGTFGRPHPRAGTLGWGSLRKFLLPAIIFLVSSAFALALSAYVWRSDTEGDRLRFEGFADDAAARLQNRVSLHISLLQATRAYLRTSDRGADRAGFADFIGNLDIEGHYGGIQGIGYAQSIETGDEATFDRTLAQTYGNDRGIFPEATDMDVRTPIRLLEPQDRRNQAAIGYDMFSDPIRRSAILRSAVTGLPSATAPVQLVQEIDENRQRGFLIYLPLREVSSGSLLGTAEAILAADGFIYAPFRAGDLVFAALSVGQDLPVSLQLYDSAIAPESLLFETPGRDTGGIHPFSTVRRLSAGGRSWILAMRPDASFARSASDLPALLLAMTGIMLALMLALLAFSQARRAEAVAALADTTSRSLEQKDLLLREMNHRIKNSITRVLAIARQTGRYSQDLEQFMGSYTARLGAMAAAQEMLNQSARRRAAIGDLLSAELGQVFGEEMENCEIEGPAIEVDEAAAQALGLTFHELATNALKYGAVGGNDGAISVTWQHEGDSIALVWRERSATSSPMSEPTRKGFGTRLIDMNIERELGGSIERRFEPEGLVVRITIPAIRAS